MIHRPDSSFFRRILPIFGLGAVVLIAFLLDPPICAWMLKRGPKPWENWARICSQVGDWPVLAGAIFAVLSVLVLGRVLRARRWMRLLCLMLISSILAGAVANSARVLAGRARPTAKVEKGWFGPTEGGVWIGGNPRYSSFPSAHTAVATAMFTPMVLFAARAWPLAFGLVFLIGWSRIYLGAHHLSDVVVAAIGGWACGWYLYRSRRGNRLIRRVVRTICRRSGAVVQPTVPQTSAACERADGVSL